MKITSVCILMSLCQLFAHASSQKGTMEVARTDVTTSFGSIYVPGVAQRTTCDQSGTINDVGPTTSVNSTTTCTTTPGRPAQEVPVAHQSADVRVIIDDQKLVIECSVGWRRCVTLQPGMYNVEYSLKKENWKDIWVFGNDTVTGKAGRVKYRVVGEW